MILRGNTKSTSFPVDHPAPCGLRLVSCFPPTGGPGVIIRSPGFWSVVLSPLPTEMPASGTLRFARDNPVYHVPTFCYVPGMIDSPPSLKKKSG